MGFLRISLLVFATVIQVYPSIANKPWQYSTNGVNNAQDDNCFCYPDGRPPTVQQLLDSKNIGQERLVIYLYKNVGTNEIKMYTPSAEKQMFIPDLPYEAGDGLATITTEYVYSLLYNNPNKIKVHNDHLENLVPAVTDSLSIGLNTGAIEDILPNTESYSNPNNNYESNEYSVPKNVNVAYGPSGDVGAQEDFSNILSIPSNIKNLDNLDQNGMTINYPYAKPINPNGFPSNPQAIPNNIQASPDLPLNLESSKYEIQHTPTNSHSHSAHQHVVYTFQTDQGSHKSPSGSNDVKNTQYMTFQTWFNQQLKRFKNINLPHDIKAIDSNVLRVLVQNTFYENNIYVSPDGVITDSKGVSMDAANLELRPLLLGETVNYKILQNTHNVIKLPKHRPYLEGILVTLISPPQILGIIPLGKTYLSESSYMGQPLSGLTTVNDTNIFKNFNAASKIPNSLTDEEIYVGPNIGSKTNHVYSGATGIPTSENFYLATHTTDYPYSIQNQIPQRSVSKVNYWGSGPYHTVAKVAYPTAKWNPSELIPPFDQSRKLSDSKIEHLYEPPTKTKIREKGVKKLAKEGRQVSGQLVTAEPFLSINTSESGRRFQAPSLTGVIKTLLNILTALPTRRGLNSTSDVDVLNEPENIEGEAPGFRIIGGNAATGSGTPLSNKGRSGFTDYA